MAWTNPKTWSSEPLTSIDLNTQLRDNQNHLKDRLDSSAETVVSGSDSITTTSTEFVDVHAGLLALNLITHGGDVLVGFTGTIRNAANAGFTNFNVAVDNVDYIADGGITQVTINGSGDAQRHKPISFVMLVAGLSPGAHTFKLRWKTKQGNTSTIDIVTLHPQFWAKEI